MSGMERVEAMRGKSSRSGECLQKREQMQTLDYLFA
jgi:hypothetical protein